MDQNIYVCVRVYVSSSVCMNEQSFCLKCAASNWSHRKLHKFQWYIDVDVDVVVVVVVVVTVAKSTSIFILGISFVFDIWFNNPRTASNLIASWKSTQQKVNWNARRFSFFRFYFFFFSTFVSSYYSSFKVCASLARKLCNWIDAINGTKFNDSKYTCKCHGYV